MYNRGYSQYKEQSVNTMTSIEMLTTVYNEAIKHLNRACMTIDIKDYVLSDKELDKSIEIVTYLDATLDMRFEISANMHSLYEFMLYEIRKAKIARKTNVLKEIVVMLGELRDSFVQASKTIH